MASNKADPVERTEKNDLGAESAALSKNFETNVEEDNESRQYSLISVDPDAADNTSVTYKGVEMYGPVPVVESEACILTPRDTRDPSYSNLTLPYRVVCRQRLHQKSKQMKKQFIKELKHYELAPRMALDGVRLRRIFCQTSLYDSSMMIKLTNKQNTRLERLMAQPL